LTVGFGSFAAPDLLPKILRKYHALYPRVVVDVLETTTIKNVESLLESTMSLALIRSPTFLSREQFCFETIQRERFVVALPDSHPAAKQESIRIKTLANEPLIVPPRQPGWGYAD
jgi:DNA-binding transcriptional LysR family regulator